MFIRSKHFKNLFLVATLLLTLFVSACSVNEGSNDLSDNEEIASNEGSFGDTKTITFVAWGGSTQEAHEEAWGVPFTEETGIKVNGDQVDYGKFRAMVESGNVEWDVVDVSTEFAYQAIREGLLEELDFSIIDTSDLDPDFVNEYFVGSYSFSYVNAYNKNEVTSEPEGWSSFFDLEKFPGSRTAYSQSPSSGIFEAALLADGVDPDEIYPIDFERAFAKLNEIKPSMKWWETGAQSQQLLASGEVSMGKVWDGRIYPIIQEGAEVAIDWTQNIKTGDVLVVPKGSKNKEAAMKFIDIATSAQPQADFSNMTGFAPINTEALDLIDEDILEYLSIVHTDTQFLLDADYWSTTRDEIMPEWNAWLLE